MENGFSVTSMLGDFLAFSLSAPSPIHFHIPRRQLPALRRVLVELQFDAVGVRDPKLIALVAAEFDGSRLITGCGDGLVKLLDVVGFQTEMREVARRFRVLRLLRLKDFNESPLRGFEVEAHDAAFSGEIELFFHAQRAAVEFEGRVEVGREKTNMGEGLDAHRG